MLVYTSAYVKQDTRQCLKWKYVQHYVYACIHMHMYMLNKTQDTRQCLKWKYVQHYAYACIHIRMYMLNKTQDGVSNRIRCKIMLTLLYTSPYAKKDTRHKTVS